MLDTAAPDITINPVTTPTATDTQTITGTMDAGATVTMSSTTGTTFGAVTTPTATTWSVLATLVEGNNEITANADDTLGNIGTATTNIVLDTAAPAEVTNFSAVAGDTIINLSWINPVDPDFVGVEIRRKQGSAPIDHLDGIPVFKGLGISFQDTGLINGTTYFYRIFTFNILNNYSSGVVASATPRRIGGGGGGGFRNTIPVITSTPIITATVNIEYLYQVEATDPDVHQTLRYSLTKNPEGMEISATGTITWIPTSAQIGGHEVTVVVSDGINTDSQTFNINVTGVGERMVCAGADFNFDDRVDLIDFGILVYFWKVKTPDNI